MLVHKLTAAECREVLAKARLGRLACARANQPYVVPISVYFDPDEHVLYGFSTVGQKIRWMRENPLVCVEVEEIVSRRHWTTVVAFGRYDECRAADGAPRFESVPTSSSRTRPNGGCPVRQISRRTNARPSRSSTASASTASRAGAWSG